MGGQVAILVFLTMVGRLLAFGREQAIVARFGAGVETDAYLVALTVPILLANAASTGILQSCIPLLSRLRVNNSDQLWPVIRTVERRLALSLGVIATLGAALSPVSLRMLAPGLSPDGLEVASRLSWILYGTVFFLGMSSFYRSVSDSHERPLFSAYGQIVQHALVVVGVLWVIPSNVTWIAVLVVGGALGQYLVQAGCNLTLKPRTKFAHQNYKPVGLYRDILILSFSGTVYEMNLVIDRLFASWLPSGYLSLLNYADKLRTIPLGIWQLIMQSIGLPHLSRVRASHREHFQSSVAAYLRLGLAGGILAGLTVSVLARSVVGLLYQHGAFSAKNADTTASFVLFYGIALTVGTISVVFQTVLLSLGQGRLVMVSSFGGMVANAFGDWVFGRIWGATGIAIATSFASMVTLVMYLSWSVRLFSNHWWLERVVDAAKILLGGAIAGLTIYVGRIVLGLGSWGDSWLMGTLKIALLVLAAFGMYFALLRSMWNVSELFPFIEGGNEKKAQGGVVS